MTTAYATFKIDALVRNRATKHQSRRVLTFTAGTYGTYESALRSLRDFAEPLKIFGVQVLAPEIYSALCTNEHITRCDITKRCGDASASCSSTHDGLATNVCEYAECVRLYSNKKAQS